MGRNGRAGVWKRMGSIGLGQKTAALPWLGSQMTFEPADICKGSSRLYFVEYMGRLHRGDSIDNGTKVPAYLPV